MATATNNGVFLFLRNEPETLFVFNVSVARQALFAPVPKALETADRMLTYTFERGRQHERLQVADNRLATNTEQVFCELIPPILRLL